MSRNQLQRCVIDEADSYHVVILTLCLSLEVGTLRVYCEYQVQLAVQLEICAWNAVWFDQPVMPMKF